MMRLLAVLALSLPQGCGFPTPAPVDPSPPKPQPAGDCAAAGAHLEALGCPEAHTPAGTSFAEACERAAADGRDWCPGAIARVSSCTEVEAASRECGP